MARAELHSTLDLSKLTRGDIVSFTPDRQERGKWSTKYLFFAREDTELGFISRGFDQSTLYLLSYCIDDLTVSLGLISAQKNAVRTYRTVRPRCGIEWEFYESILHEHTYDAID